MNMKSDFQLGCYGTYSFIDWFHFLPQKTGKNSLITPFNQLELMEQNGWLLAKK